MVIKKSYKIIFALLILSLLFIPKIDNTSASEVTVKSEEMLTVKVTLPSSWANGTPSSAGVFLRNEVILEILTNNEVGFTATMTSATTNTSLVNSSNTSYTIPTLSDNSLRSSFPNDFWGYSLDDTAGGNTGSTYKPVAPYGAAEPNYIANSAYSSTATSKTIYFGTKATSAKAAGVYSNTVVFNVVSGINTSDTSQNGVTPTNPVNPGDDPSGDDTPTYISSNNATVYTRRDGTTTGTVVTPGNTTSATYSSPAGVTTTRSSVNEGTPLATGLAVTAGVAVTTGIFFFIAAKRRKDDEEEEEEGMNE